MMRTTILMLCAVLLVSCGNGSAEKKGGTRPPNNEQPITVGDGGAKKDDQPPVGFEHRVPGNFKRYDAPAPGTNLVPRAYTPVCYSDPSNQVFVRSETADTWTLKVHDKLGPKTLIVEWAKGSNVITVSTIPAGSPPTGYAVDELTLSVSGVLQYFTPGTGLPVDAQNKERYGTIHTCPNGKCSYIGCTGPNCEYDPCRPGATKSH